MLLSLLDVRLHMNKIVKLNDQHVDYYLMFGYL